MNVDLGGLPVATSHMGPESGAPQPAVPGTAAALPIAETALRHVLASQGSTRGAENSTATALDLLRNVEALLQASAPQGTSAADLEAAAARLVERQGLLARLSASAPGPLSQPTSDLWRGTASDGVAPSEVDTRL